MRISAAGYRGWAIPKTIIRYRRHGRTRVYQALEREQEFKELIRGRYQEVAQLPRPQVVKDVRPEEAFLRMQGRPLPPGGQRALALPGGEDAEHTPDVIRLLLKQGHEVFACHAAPLPESMRDSLGAWTPYVYDLGPLFRVTYFLDFRAHIVRDQRASTFVMSPHDPLGSSLLQRFPALVCRR